jgi:hypothetical protein
MSIIGGIGLIGIIGWEWNIYFGLLPITGALYLIAWGLKRTQPPEDVKTK